MPVSTADLVVIRRHLDVVDCAALHDACARLPLQWQPGRQGSGYDKASVLDHLDDVIVGAAVAAIVRVLGDPQAVDGWWIVYPPGSGIAAHVDPAPVDGYAHVRANLVVSQGRGGVFVADDFEVALDVGDLVVFRPDVVRHAVTTVEGSARHVLSVGTIWPVEMACDVFMRAVARRHPQA